MFEQHTLFMELIYMFFKFINCNNINFIFSFSISITTEPNNKVPKQLFRNNCLGTANING